MVTAVAREVHYKITRGTEPKVLNKYIKEFLGLVLSCLEAVLTKPRFLLECGFAAFTDLGGFPSALGATTPALPFIVLMLTG
jgi:hypothetical protein